MKIIEKINLNKNKLNFSFEFFPPKTNELESDFFNTIKILKRFNPNFISLTYGALGSNQEKSFSMLKQIKEKFDLDITAHFTCIGASPSDVDFFLEKLKEYKIDNILALRGDVPPNVDKKTVLSYFNYASELVEYIRAKTNYFCIAVAGYPETHLESLNKKSDLKYLKNKIDKGAEFIITQLFFDNKYFYDFCEKLYKQNVKVPVIPGIMPVTNYKMIEKITSMCNVKVPDKIKKLLNNENLKPEDGKKIAFEWTYNQCKDLISNKINNLHFYTLNKSSVVYDVCEKLI